MTRQHFRAIAQALKNANADYNTCLEMARVCKAYNPRFDYATFMHACGHAL